MTPKQTLARAKQIDQLAQKEYEKADNHWLTAIINYAQAKNNTKTTQTSQTRKNYNKPNTKNSKH